MLYTTKSREESLIEWYPDLKNIPFWCMDEVLVKWFGVIYQGRVVFVRPTAIPEYGVRLYDESLVEIKDPKDMFLVNRFSPDFLSFVSDDPVNNEISTLYEG